ncbi:MAG: T9SS type A sorting domain-containing protein [Flavobacteriaceae bacterium]
MKTIVSFYVFLLSIVTFSQEYIPMLQEGNAWSVDLHYNLFAPPPNVPCCYTISVQVSLGETIMINGLEYKQIYSNNNPSCLLREENGKVYKYDEALQLDKVVFDFSLEEGDVFPLSGSVYEQFPYNISCASENFFSIVYENELHVSSIEYLQMAGETRKVINFEEGSWLSYSWIEGIGNVTGFDLMAEAIDITDYSILSCFTNNGETYFMFGATACDNTTLQLPENLKNEIFLYPNPITNISILQFPETLEISSLKIFNETGKLLKVETISKNNYTIDVMHYASGLYFYQVFSEGTLLKSDTFIVK